MRKAFILTICIIVSSQYAYMVYSPPVEYWAYYSQKPFVYRQLVPILASFLPFENRLSIAFVAFAFCVGLFLVMLYIYENSYSVSKKNDILFLVSFSATLALVCPSAKYYDMPSAMFFLLLLVLWGEKKYAASIPVFALACINRETTILLILFFVFVHRNLLFSLLLLIIYSTIRYAIITSFSSVDGQTAYVNLFKNIAIHLKYIVPTLFMVLVATLALIAILYKFKNWQHASFVFILFPCFVALYLTVGLPFETRVFVEVAPILFMQALLILNQ